MHAETCHTPDPGYMGDPRRGASLGRSPRNAAATAAAIREDIAIAERVLSQLADPACDYLFDHMDAARREALATRLRADIATGRERLPTIDPEPRFHLRRVRLDSGGYDSGGAYWGHGGQLFEAFTDDGAEFLTVRAWERDGREAAKAEVRETYPRARFYR